MLVGRDSEIRSITQVLSSACDGRADILVICGEAGIGKSSLLDVAARLATERDFRVLRVTGLQSEAELAYSGLLELCGPVLGVIENLVEPHRRALHSALELGPAASADRFAVGAAALGLFAECAESRPLAVIVDDAQWLDRASADALWFAVRRLDADRVACLIAVRAGPGDRLPGGLADARFAELTVDGLDPHSTRELLEGGTDRIARDVVGALHDGTRGNPLALVEIARSLSPEQLAGYAALTDPLAAPLRLREIFAGDLAALDERTRHALVVLATSGSDDYATLIRTFDALGLSVGDLLIAERVGLVVLAPGSATFRHPLVRSAVYHAATPAERRAAHGALADAPGTAFERAAWHRAEATLAPDEDVAAGLERAAEAALARGGSLAAATAFGRAASLTPDRAPRTRRLAQAADAFWMAGATLQAQAMLADAAQTCDDPLQLAAIRQLEGHIALHTSSPQQAHDQLVRDAQAVAALDPGRAASMIGTAAEAALYRGDHAATLATARMGRELTGERTGMGGFLVAALMGCGMVGTGLLDEGRRELRAAIAIAQADPALATDQRVLGWLVPVYGYLDDFDGALAAARHAEAQARARGALGELVYVLPTRAAYEYAFGSWVESFANMSESAQLALECGQTIDRVLALSGVAELAAARGDGAACRAVVAEYDDAIGDLDGFRTWPAFALGLLALGAGDAAGAAALLEPVVSLEHGQGQHRPVMAVFDLVEAKVMTGELSSASAILDAVERSYSGRDWELAGIARGRGLLAGAGDYDDAFAQSFALLEQLGMRFERARTELCWGERRRRDGRRIECRPLLRSALATFIELGARPWADRAASELRASGETARRTADARDELTARELQVALRASDGKTNREVGAALFLSPKTVDIHLSRAYRKLGIHSRSELGPALGRRRSE